MSDDPEQGNKVLGLQIVTLVHRIDRDLVSLREMRSAATAAHDREHNAVNDAISHGDTALQDRVDALRETVNRDLAALRELQAAHAVAHDREHAAVQTAIQKAEDAMTIRLTQMNEFRQQLEGERNLLAKRDYVDQRIEGLVKGQDDHTESLSKLIDANASRVANLELALATIGGRFAAATVGLTVAIFIVSIAVSLAMNYIK